jgi:hypothetical protein
VKWKWQALVATLVVDLLAAACIITVAPVVVPRPPATATFDVAVCRHAPADNYCDGMPATVTLDGFGTAPTDGNGYLFLQGVPTALVDTFLTVTAPGYQPYQSATLHPKDLVAANAAGRHNFFELTPLPPKLPPPPTRDQMLNVCMTFQGLMVPTAQFGPIPWFDAALFSLSPADRLQAYAAKHASTACNPAGDTHAVLTFDTNHGSLYDEPGNPYQQMNSAGFADNLPAFVAAVKEVVAHGFHPVVFFDERHDGPVPEAMHLFPLAWQALATSDAGDLNRYVLWMPGWDGVFYGWDPPSKIVDWGAQGRRLCPACYLGLEFNPGHIPLGEGGGDYAPGGRMQDFDVLFAEWNNDDLHSDVSWQVLGRLLGPAYHRPPDQPVADDTRPPWYLKTPNPRGPWFVNCFEFNEYEWVRLRVSAADVQAKRAYLYSLGCSVVN